KRQGCMAAAIVAASSTWRIRVASTTTITVTASPLATPPALRLSAASFLTTSEPLVSQSASMSGPPPLVAVPREHLIGLSRAPLAGAVEVRHGPGPGRLERVDDPPTLLDLGRVGEQGPVPDEHVEDEPLVRLGAALGEGLAVAEVHRDVAQLHRRPRHLRTELQHDALVRLDPHDQ